MSRTDSRSLVAELKKLEVDYRSGASIVHAVQGASIEVAEGQAVGIVGESGSGKSTVARALLGLLDSRNSAIVGGRIMLGGRDVTDFDSRQWQKVRGNPAAMVFQDPLTYLNPVMTVGRQIEEGVRLHDPQVKPARRIAELLEMVKLPVGVARSYPDELSGGMRQRALLAVALACRPRLLIADEPTTALDVTTQAEIMDLLGDLRRQTGMAMLLISHDLGLVASICETIYVMYAGRTIEWGSTAAVFDTPSHPYTRGLLDAAEGRRTRDGLFVTIRGDVPDLRLAPVGCPFEPRCSYVLPECAVMPDASSMDDRGAHQVRCHAARSHMALTRAAR
jgi:oligopeptide/dipeptide ABC transporter ATP-binding protein